MINELFLHLGIQRFCLRFPSYCTFLSILFLFPSRLSVAPLPSPEWPLPSQSGQYELLIQQEPRSHHRAHYETEGSRGAVKTPNGGHPEVQVLFCLLLKIHRRDCKYRGVFIGLCVYVKPTAMMQMTGKANYLGTNCFKLLKDTLIITNHLC